ncbi:PREDICTED: pentatricopeptide repeat-containing protein At5g27270 [Fragaria vesca subsp. vesca]|uniref:pentatricopeptide repeat-containing protein At5g27270 n=1 Tax=Fragaria vesca subsp. vesca TaxID=101020 RepID=UPI0002C37456|nr:PREDICTED: pentatricopeptide repeat-containing protein At5g27270 [Fragaria vesca subsp. vesca]
MESLHLSSNYSSFFCTTTTSSLTTWSPLSGATKPKIRLRVRSSVTPDPWSLSDGNPDRPKPKSKHPKNPLSDDNARRIIKSKARYLSALRRNQGPHAQTPKWIKRTPEQMVRYLQDDRNGHLYGRHVVAAIKRVRSLSEKAEGEYDMRTVMSSFVGKLSFREMCVVLKEQKGWRQVRDFFDWMKLQLSYRPTVIVYTIVLRTYGQIGKIKLAEQTFLEMLEAGCEPDEVACGTMLCTYARWGREKAMLAFYSAVQERGIVLSVAVYNFMLSSLQKKGMHEKVVQVWRQMVGEGVVPNKFTYTVVISSLVKEGLVEEALKSFEECKSVGFVPEEATYSMLISLSTKSGNYEQALRLYEDMRSMRIVPSNYTCASLLALYYKKEDYSKALSLFSEMEREKIAADEVIYGLLIRIYGKLGLYEDAQTTFKEMEQLGLLSDQKTYLAMAQVNLNSGNYDKALEVIELMKSRNNIWLSRFAYIVLLQCYVMKEDLSSAEVTFQALSKTGLPDAGSCNDMLNLYIRLGLMEKAKDFIVQIRRDRVDFDEELFRTVMSVYCKEGMLGDTEQLINELSTSRLFKDSRFVQTISRAIYEHKDDQQPKGKLVTFFQPDTTALGLVLSLYLANGNMSKIQRAVALLLETSGGLSTASQIIRNIIRDGDAYKAEIRIHQLLKLGCRVDNATISSLISVYGKKHKLKKAQEIYTAFADSPLAKKILCNSMLDAYAKCGKSEEAYSLYRQLTEEGHDLDAVAISIVVNALTHRGKHREAENVIRQSLEHHSELDTVAYNTFIKAMLEAGRLHFASSIYESMLSQGVTPSIQTFNTMISVYGRGRKLDRAVEMFNTACSLGLSPDEKAYMNLISYYGKAGKRHEASMLFAKMRESIKPGMVSYNIMMNVYATGGLYEEAEQLFKAMKQDGWLPDSFTYLSLVRAYTESLKYSEAEETINSMQEDGVYPSCSHFNLILSAFAKMGLIGEAERVYEELIAAGLNPDAACCGSMLRGYMDYGHVEEGIKFFEQNSDSIKADRFILSAAVHLYKSVGKEVEAQNVLHSMSSMGISFLEKLEVGSKLKSLPMLQN